MLDHSAWLDLNAGRSTQLKRMSYSVESSGVLRGCSGADGEISAVPSAPLGSARTITLTGHKWSPVSADSYSVVSANGLIVQLQAGQ